MKYFQVLGNGAGHYISDMKRISLTKLHNVTKMLLILLIGVISYFTIFLILNPFLITEPTPMMNIMRQMMPGMMNFSTSGLITVNLISLIIAIIAALILSFYLFKHDSKEQEYKIIRKAVSEDEKRILDEIKKAGEITQDSLRFRLGWSKAKISTILTNLDKRNLIQRERTGKTYKVYLQER